MKGSVFDMFFIIVGVFLIAIGVFFGNAILDSLDLTEHNSELDQQYITDGESALQLMDWGLMFILVMMIVAGLILASQIRTHPVFIIPAIIIIIFAIFIAVVISNTFEEIASTDQMTNTSAKFTTIGTVMTNLPLIIFMAGGLILIIIYGKTKDSISEV